MAYLIVKTLHILLIIGWVAGFAVIAAANLAIAGDPGARGEQDIWRLVRAWDRWAFAPILFAALTMGAVLAAWSGAFTMAWLQLKIVGVTLLFAASAVQSGFLQRQSTPGAAPLSRRAVAVAFSLSVALLAMVVALAVIKPG